VENSNSPLIIRFVAKTSDIRNFSQNIRSDVKTSEVATLVVSLTAHKTKFLTLSTVNLCQASFIHSL